MFFSQFDLWIRFPKVDFWELAASRVTGALSPLGGDEIFSLKVHGGDVCPSSLAFYKEELVRWQQMPIRLHGWGTAAAR